MADNPLSQKQTGQKYTDNLGYFRKPHYLRRLRTWVFVVTTVGTLAAVASFRFWGKDEVFSAGPLSKKHAHLGNNCSACHLPAKNGLAGALFSAIPGGMDTGSPAAHSGMDQACLGCHSSFSLHQPGAAGLSLRKVSNELAVVHAENCMVCHREHSGPGRMALPSQQTCVSCHNNPDELRRSRPSLPLKNPAVAATGENRDLGDGLIRFVTSARSAGSLKPFASYAEGHPPFAYENLRDPADLKFNHARHQREDIKLLNRKLACEDCHKPGPGGVFYQPVSYNRDCQQCHSLQIVPNLPKLLVPHGDPEKVRYFLASLRVSVEGTLRTASGTDAVDVESEMQRLGQRGLDSLEALEQRVFFEGDPKTADDDSRRRTENRKFLTECAKCHTVSPGSSGSAPKINPPNMAERWVQRGPFTHAPHQHMTCADCHGAALVSKETTDILLPGQKLCAECHRPPDKAIFSESDDSLRQKAWHGAEAINVARTQRETGGIKWDCQSCHTFHAPAGTVSLISNSGNQKGSRQKE